LRSLRARQKRRWRFTRINDSKDMIDHAAQSRIADSLDVDAAHVGDGVAHDQVDRTLVPLIIGDGSKGPAKRVEIPPVADRAALIIISPDPGGNKDLPELLRDRIDGRNLAGSLLALLLPDPWFAMAG